MSTTENTKITKTCLRTHIVCSGLAVSEYRYDEHGRVVEIDQDSNGVMKKYVIRYLHGKFVTALVDEAGDTIARTWYWHSGDKIRRVEGPNRSEQRTYDDQGRLHYVADTKSGFASLYTRFGDTLAVKKVFFNDTLKRVYRLYYDERNMPVRAIEDTEKQLSYEFDKYSSWTRRTAIVVGGENETITRKIVYY